MRTSFLWDDLKRPVQVVHRKLKVPFEHLDLSGLDHETRGHRLAEIQEKDFLRGFDVRRAPLLRVTIVRLGDREHYMFWNRHHLILDRWCVDLLFEELFAAYRGESVSGVPGTFKDYVAWLQQQDARLPEEYWRKALAGFTEPSLMFPPGVRNGTGVRQVAKSLEVELPGDLGAMLIDFAAKTHISFAALVQGAVGILVSAWTGHNDVAFGLTVSGRPPDLPKMDSAMGSFINNVPTRIVLPSVMRARDWLQSIHQAQAQRFRYEHVSPSEIQRWSPLRPNQPLFDLLTLLHSPPAERRQGPGFVVEQLESMGPTAYPMTLSIGEVKGRMQFNALYQPSFVSDELARKVYSDLREILSALCEPGDKTVGELVSRVIAPARPSSSVTLDHAARTTAESGLPSPESPADELTQIMEAVLGIDGIGVDDDFFALGGTSIQAARLFTEMNHRLGYDLPLSTLFRSANVRDILRAAGKEQPPRSALVEIQSHGNRPRIFAVSGIGGHTIGLRDLARSLGRDQPVFGLESPGIDGAGQPMRRIEDIASLFLKQMAPVSSDPIVLLGICWGATVVFEMAHQLTQSGSTPELLILVDPSMSDSAIPTESAHPPATLLGLALERARLYVRELRAQERGERLPFLKEKAQNVSSALLNRPSAELQREMVENRVLDAHSEAAERYRPTPYRGRTTLLFTSERESDLGTEIRRDAVRLLPSNSPVFEIPGKDTGDALSRNNVGPFAQRIESEVETLISCLASSLSE